MKLQYLGTAAAEGVPAVFCGCASCRRSRALGGRNIRSRSQALVNGSLLIDFPCDTFYHFVNNGLDLLDIKACLVTHTHSDHFYPDDLYYPRSGYSYPPADWQGFHLYGSEDLQEPLKAVVAGGKVTVHTVAPFTPFPAAGLQVTALPAVHGTPHPYVYLVSDGGKTLLYCHDSGPFPASTWDRLAQQGIRFDLVSLDCTEGMCPQMHYDHHMCFYRNAEFRAEAVRRGLADESTLFVLNHFSHNGVNSVYADFAPAAEREGFLTAYDGMTLEF